jgi:hypothetical protein
MTGWKTYVYISVCDGADHWSFDNCVFELSTPDKAARFETDKCVSVNDEATDRDDNELTNRFSNFGRKLFDGTSNVTFLMYYI